MKFAVFLALIGSALTGTNTASETSFGFNLNHIAVGDVLPVSGRITGGHEAIPGEFPWQISIQIQPDVGSRYHTCGGTILDSTHIICAAHCVIGQTLTNLTVVAGAQNIKRINERSQKRVNVKRLVFHPDYNGNTIVNDDSIITLATPLEFNERVQGIRLAPEGHEPTGLCVTTGWGNSNEYGGDPAIVPDSLQKVELTIVDRTTCRQRYAGINGVDNSMVCAGSGPLIGSCNGDSGSPLVCSDIGEPYLAGIVSWGMLPCGQERYPSVFGNVAFLRPFLDAEGIRP